jgi:hypothetical protein
LALRPSNDDLGARSCRVITQIKRHATGSSQPVAAAVTPRRCLRDATQNTAPSRNRDSGRCCRRVYALPRGQVHAATAVASRTCTVCHCSCTSYQRPSSHIARSYDNRYCRGTSCSSPRRHPEPPTGQGDLGCRRPRPSDSSPLSLVRPPSATRGSGRPIRRYGRRRASPCSGSVGSGRAAR